MFASKFSGHVNQCQMVRIYILHSLELSTRIEVVFTTMTYQLNVLNRWVADFSEVVIKITLCALCNLAGPTAYIRNDYNKVGNNVAPKNKFLKLILSIVVVENGCLVGVFAFCSSEYAHHGFDKNGKILKS